MLAVFKLGNTHLLSTLSLTHLVQRPRHGLDGRGDGAAVVLRDVPFSEPHARAEQTDQGQDPEQPAEGSDGAAACNLGQRNS